MEKPQPKRRPTSETPVSDEPARTRYMATDECWVDVPEAKPRARVRVPVGDPPTMVVVLDDTGEWEDLPSNVLVDHYEDIPAMRDELKQEDEA